MSTLDERALAFAANAHLGQKRKYTNEPYIVHPMEVANIVCEVYSNTSASVRRIAMASAYLHDVVEDCGVSIEEIYSEFGDKVGTMVFWLTDVSKPSDGNREFRKKLDRTHIGHAPNMAKTIKLADIISNTPSIIEHDKDFAKVYLREIEKLMSVMSGGNYQLRWRVRDILRDNEKIWQY